MGCGCAGRQQLLVSAGRQIAQGNARAAAERAALAARSMAYDARRITQNAQNAARAQYARMIAARRGR